MIATPRFPSPLRVPFVAALRHPTSFLASFLSSNESHRLLHFPLLFIVCMHFEMLLPIHSISSDPQVTLNLHIENCIQQIHIWFWNITWSSVLDSTDTTCYKYHQSAFGFPAKVAQPLVKSAKFLCIPFDSRLFALFMQEWLFTAAWNGQTTPASVCLLSDPRMPSQLVRLLSRQHLDLCGAALHYEHYHNCHYEGIHL